MITDPLELEDYMVGEFGSGYFSSLAVVNGNPAISFFSMTLIGATLPDASIAGTLQYVRATDADGSAWNTAVVVDDSAVTGADTSLAVVNGNPAISYYNIENGALMYVRAQDADGTAWNTPVEVDNAADAYPGDGTSLVVVNGKPAISYFDNINGILKYVRAQDADGAAWGAPVAADNTEGVGLWASMAVVNGHPAISYYDTYNAALNYVRAQDVDGDAWGTPVQVDADADVGDYCSLAVVDGSPAISYYDYTNGSLKYVRASNADGSAWNAPVVVDASEDAGDFSSLEVVEGRPAISYFDWWNGVLKFVRANDTDGTDWPDPLVADGSLGAGGYSSLAVVNGNPAISYFDFLNGALKYTRASDASGGTWPYPEEDSGGWSGGKGGSWANTNVDPCKRDIVVDYGETITGGCVSGTVTSKGTLDGVEVMAGASVTGGEICGTITNGGTIRDVSIAQGCLVKGGEMGGTIINSGTLDGVTLLPGTKITGGTFENVVIPSDVQVINGTINDTAFQSGSQAIGCTIKNTTFESGSQMVCGTMEGGAIQSGAQATDVTLVNTLIDSGGNVSGGFLKDVTIGFGGQVTGGTLEGDISNSGNISDITLSAGTKIKGGKLSGTITGDPQDPARIMGDFMKNAVLSHVVVDAGSKLSSKCSLVEGVKFITNAVIPNGIDLMPILCKTGGSVAYMKMNETIDLSCDVLWPADAYSLLNGINTLPDFAGKNIVFSQDAITGTVHAQLPGVIVCMRPTVLSQRKDLDPGVTVKEDGTIDIITGYHRRIILQPMVYQADTFKILLENLGFDDPVKYDDGIISVTTGILSKFFLRPDLFVTQVPQPAGVQPAKTAVIKTVASSDLPSFGYVTMEFPYDGQTWNQTFYPTPPDRAELKNGLQALCGSAGFTCSNNGVVQFTSNGTARKGILSYAATQTFQGPSSMQMIPVPDQNGDGIDDMKLVYPCGWEQMLYMTQ